MGISKLFSLIVVSLIALTGLAETSAYAQTGSNISYPPGLVSYLPGDGNGTDLVGGNNGTLMNGAAYTAGKLGMAFSLDGIDDFVSLGNPNNLKIGSAITLSAWIKPTNPPNGLAAIISKWGQNASIDAYSYYLITSNGNVRLLGALGVPNQGDPGFTEGVIPIGDWSHVVMTYDSANGLNKIYINGIKVAERFRPGGITVSDKNVLLGREDSGAGRHFSGAIDEVQIYNRALTASEVRGLFEAVIVNSAGNNGQCQSELALAEKQIADLQGQVITLTNQNSTLQATATQLQRELDAANQSLQKLQQSMNSLVLENSTLKDQNSQLLNQNTQLQSQVTQLQSQVMQLQSALAQANSTNQKLQATIDSLTGENLKLQGLIAALTSENQRLQGVIDTLTKENQAVSNGIASIVNGIQQNLQNSYKDPDFRIPGGNDMERLQNLLNAIVNLNHGQKQGIYKNLGGKK